MASLMKFDKKYITVDDSCDSGIRASGIKGTTDVLDFAVTRLLMKLFRTSNTEIIAECQHYFGFSFPNAFIERKRNKFVNSYNNVLSF